MNNSEFTKGMKHIGMGLCWFGFWIGLGLCNFHGCSSYPERDAIIKEVLK